MALEKREKKVWLCGIHLDNGLDHTGNNPYIAPSKQLQEHQPDPRKGTYL